MTIYTIIKYFFGFPFDASCGKWGIYTARGNNAKGKWMQSSTEDVMLTFLAHVPIVTLPKSQEEIIILQIVESFLFLLILMGK